MVRLVSTRLGWVGGHIGEVRGYLWITGGDTISQALKLYITVGHTIVVVYILVVQSGVAMLVMWFKAVRGVLGVTGGCFIFLGLHGYITNGHTSVVVYTFVRHTGLVMLGLWFNVVSGVLGVTGGDTIIQALGLYITALVSSGRQDIS